MSFPRRTLFRTGLVVTAAGVTGTPVMAATTAAVPVIDGTDAWGARPPTGTIQVINSRPVKIVVHHTASDNTTDYSKAQAYALSRAIQNHHMDNNGWIDTGQQFTNSRGGYITEGRHRSLEALRSGTRHVVGAHTRNQNSVTIGIENEGLYMTSGPTDAQWNSLVALCRYMCSQYGISPQEIYGHRDFNNTLCPGDVLYARLPELRSAVGATETRVPTWPLLRLGDVGPKVLAAQHLLRAHGARDLSADGVYSTATAAAARRFAESNGVVAEQCYGTRSADEGDLLGADTWPLLARTVHADDQGEFGKAARALGRITSPVVDTQAWRTLLSS